MVSVISRAVLTRYLGCSPGTFAAAFLSVTIITLGTGTVPHLSHGDGDSVRHSMRCHRQPVFLPCVLRLSQGAVISSRSGVGMCSNSLALLIRPPRDPFHGTSYNHSINMHHKVCNHYSISGYHSLISNRKQLRILPLLECLTEEGYPLRLQFRQPPTISVDMSLSRSTMRTRTFVRPQREVPSLESMFIPLFSLGSALLAGSYYSRIRGYGAGIHRFPKELHADGGRAQSTVKGFSPGAMAHPEQQQPQRSLFPHGPVRSEVWSSPLVIGMIARLPHSE